MPANTSEYNRRYRQNHRELLNRYQREYYQKNKEKRREYKRKEYQEHKEKYRKRRKENRQKYRERDKEQRKRALALYGNECFFCKYSGERLEFHKKDGQRHFPRVAPLVLKNPDDFSLLCFPCHKAIHWVMRFFGLSWNEILSHLDK